MPFWNRAESHRPPLTHDERVLNKIGMTEEKLEEFFQEIDFLLLTIDQRQLFSIKGHRVLRKASKFWKILGALEDRELAGRIEAKCVALKRHLTMAQFVSFDNSLREIERAMRSDTIGRNHIKQLSVIAETVMKANQSNNPLERYDNLGGYNEFLRRLHLLRITLSSQR